VRASPSGGTAGACPPPPPPEHATCPYSHGHCSHVTLPSSHPRQGRHPRRQPPTAGAVELPSGRRKEGHPDLSREKVVHRGIGEGSESHPGAPGEAASGRYAKGSGRGGGEVAPAMPVCPPGAVVVENPATHHALRAGSGVMSCVMMRFHQLVVASVQALSTGTAPAHPSAAPDR